MKATGGGVAFVTFADALSGWQCIGCWHLIGWRTRGLRSKKTKKQRLSISLALTLSPTSTRTHTKQHNRRRLPFKVRAPSIHPPATTEEKRKSESPVPSISQGFSFYPHFFPNFWQSIAIWKVPPTRRQASSSALERGVKRSEVTPDG
jgi:hypothetical protein